MLFGRFFRFSPRHQPYMVRQAYRYELGSAVTFPLAASLAEGSFTGVVAAKYFQASPLLIAVITAAPMFGQIMAIVWSELAKSRRKVRFVNGLQLGVVLIIASVALTRPMPQHIGGWVFAAQIVVARILASGIITLRSVIWGINYPRHLRGQIAGRITVIATAVLAAATFAGSTWLDRSPQAYIYLYPAASFFGIIGVWQFSHVRVRWERQTLRQHQLQPAPPGSALRALLFQAPTILRQDKAFRDYQRWQFLSGASFMMLSPPLVFLVSTKLTDPRTQYRLATVVLQVIPMLTVVLTTQLWSPIFDRMHITRFRVVQCSVSVLAQLVLCIGAVTLQLPLVALGQVLIGFSNAGGNLAWSLGHNDFAPPGKADTYMGVHVMLTGLRGCIAPFVGVYLYKILRNEGMVFGVSSLVCFISLLGFLSMARTAPAKVRARAIPVEEPVAVGASAS